jgi:glycerol dehydrogenase-like iron-containing ADH family enzyme
MWLTVNDGKVIFATHLISLVVNDEFREKLPFQVEKDGIVCYSTEELSRAEQALNKLGIPYTVEELAIPTETKEKAKGIKYQNRSEAVEHLLHNREPEHVRSKNLLKRLEFLEKELATTKQKLAEIEQKQKIEPLTKRL